MDKLRTEAHELTAAVEALTRSVSRSRRVVRWLGVSLALTVLSLAALGFVGWKVRGIADCQAEQNAAFQSAAVAGRNAAALDRQGQQRLLDTVLDPGAGREQRRAAIEEYRTYLADAEAVRRGNPLPPPADCR